MSSSSTMKKGELVRILNRANWGGIQSIEHRGILIKKIYQAYSQENDEWEVLINGKCKRIRGKNLVKTK